MQTIVYLVRHAHSVYTPDEYRRPLSPKGLEDAARITDILQKEKIDLVISSPYKRAVQTVEGIAKIMGKKVIEMDGFKERILSVMPVDDFGLAIAEVWRHPTFCLEGGESNNIAQKRGIQSLLQLLQTCEGKTMVIGTHGNLMALVMNYFDQRYDFNFWKNLDMPDMYKLTFEKNTLKDVSRVWFRNIESPSLNKS